MIAAPKKTSSLDNALAHQRRGDLAAAEAGFRAVLAQDADNPDALIFLGEICRKSSRADEAVGLVETAIAAAAKRGHKVAPSWRVALAYAKRDSGNLEGALADTEAMVVEAPDVVEPRFLRAGMLQRLDRHEGALRDYQAVLKRAPDYAPAVNEFGVSLYALGHAAEAKAAFERALKLNPKLTLAKVNLAKLMLDAGQIGQGLAKLRQACALDSANRAAENTLIEMLMANGEHREAEAVAEKVLERYPNDLQALVQLAGIRMVMGRRESAVELARRARAISPQFPNVLTLLQEADRDADPRGLLADIEGVLSGPLVPVHRIGLHFSAAYLYEKESEFSRAFDHYAAGNRERKDHLVGLGYRYDRGPSAEDVDELIAAFGSETMVGRTGSDSELPVFIIGMPRSGTTLTEQILASHPQIGGAGELNEIGQVVRWLRAEHGYPNKLAPTHVKRGADGYLRHIGRIGRGATRVTDKMPTNFYNLGLITRMFPSARIIHTRRDPMDNCLSCFTRSFRSDVLVWSCDLEDLAHQYCQYRRIMGHWREVLPPGRMLEIDYEDTVADLEGQARRLVDFVGLEWDDACLRFHETERAVATASREQVRRPIYTSSVGRWKRYGDGVLPLARALDACGRGPGMEAGGL